jgi:ZIP family zinc transporter
MTAILLSVLTFFSTALGGLFALHRRRNLYLIMGFSAGLLVGAALLDLLPDALDLVREAGQPSASTVLLGAALGFLTFYALDRFLHHGAAGHEARGGKAAFGSAAALGLTVHSFLDGFAIGSAFQATAAVGMLVAAAVIAHDFGDGVTTVGIVLGSRAGVRTSLAWLLADAAAPVAGAATALLLPTSPGLLAELLGFFAGSFLFIGAAHLLPEAEQEARGPWLPVAVVAGFVFIFVVTRLLGGVGGNGAPARPGLRRGTTATSVESHGQQRTRPSQTGGSGGSGGSGSGGPGGGASGTSSGLPGGNAGPGRGAGGSSGAFSPLVPRFGC